MCVCVCVYKYVYVYVYVLYVYVCIYISEIEAVRQLLNNAEDVLAHERQKAEERLAHERQLRHVLEQMHAKLGTHFNIVKSPIKKKQTRQTF